MGYSKYTVGKCGFEPQFSRFQSEELTVSRLSDASAGIYSAEDLFVHLVHEAYIPLLPFTSQQEGSCA